MRNFKLFLFVISICVTACSDFTEDNTCLSAQNLNEQRLNNGAKGELFSPMALDVMEEAIANVAPNLTRGVGTLEPTHKYIRFLPRNVDQFDALNEHYTIFNFPLDNIPDIPEGEGCVSSKNLSDVPYMYSVIEYDKKLPDSIEWCQIKTIFNPYASELFADNKDLAEEIMISAYEISQETETQTKAAISTWIPRGTIKVWDDVAKQYVPVEGVRVYCSNSQMTDTQGSVTDQYGYFQSNVSFVDDVEYILHWKSDEWLIKYGDLVPAITICTIKPNAFDLNIAAHNFDNYYAATIFRAANYYWNYSPSYHDLTAPTMSNRVKIKCVNEHLSEEGWAGYFSPGANWLNNIDIHVYCKDWATDIIMRTTFHELAHAAHCVGAGLYWNEQTESVVQESWACFVEYLLTEGQYSYIDGFCGTDCMSTLFELYPICDDLMCYVTYLPNSINRQTWEFDTPTTTSEYTPLFIDIYDRFNQRTYYAGTYREYNVPNDNLYVPDVAWIEDCAFNKLTVNGVREALINDSSILNISVSDINSLFELYLDIEED